MNRKGFLKSIAMLAVAPKIISEMEFKPPLKSDKFKGLIPTILKEEYTVVEYAPRNFTISDFHNLVEKYDKEYKRSTDKYFWFEKRDNS